MRNQITVAYSQTYEEWVVEFNGLREENHRLKQDAEKSGRSMAKRNKPSRFVVQRKDGSVSYEQNYIVGG